MKLTGTLNIHYKIGNIITLPIRANIVSSPPPPSPTVGTEVKILLKHFFFRYSSTASDEGEGSTDENGNFEIDVTPDSDVTMEIFAHNAAVRAAKYPVIAHSTSISIENAFTAAPATHPVVTLSDLTPGLSNESKQDFEAVKTAFITAILLQDSYQNGFKEFTPWRKSKSVPYKISDNNFPVGYKTTRQDDDQIDVLIPGLTVKLPYNNPIPAGNPTIHYGDIPYEFAHEFGHALQFIKSSLLQRSRILSVYAWFLFWGTDDGETFTERREHKFDKPTTPFVAFLEAFAMFAGAFYQARRLFSPPLNLTVPTGVAPADALHPEHHQIFYHLYRFNSLANGGGTEVPDISNNTSTPTVLSRPLPSNPPTRYLLSWPSAPLEEVEGAIFSALYIDYAKRDSIGLDFVVTSYMQSGALTLQEYVDWIRGQYGTYSPQYIELFDVMTTWGMLTSAGLAVPGKFLRTPVSEEILSNLSNLVISEITTSSNPKYGDPPSGGMEMTWDTGANQPVEISPIFAGWVRFLADSDPIKPVGLLDATMSEYGDWTVTGRLVITPFGGQLKRDFLAHLPGSLIPNPPDQIMYEPIRLTPEFFSETLAKAALVNYSEGTVPPPPTGSISFNKLVYEFINGRALMQSTFGVPLKVVADKHKTVVRAGLSKEYLWVTTSTRSGLVLDTTGSWWLIPGANDFKGLPSPTTGSVEPIIHSSFTSLPAANFLETQTYDPLHPNHTVIPLWMILHEVGNSVLVDDPTTHPILTSISTSNKKHCRIELKRWNSEKGGSPQPTIFERQYPFFQVIVTWLNDSSKIAARVPASGVVFLPLEIGIHSFKVAPRWESPPNFGGNTQAIFISLDSLPGGLVIPPGNASIEVDIKPGTEVVELYISSVEYDSNIVWERLKSQVESSNYKNYKSDRVKSSNRVVSLDVDGKDVTDAFLPVYFSGVIEDHFRSHQLCQRQLEMPIGDN
jgi:hypothetical protein